MSHGGASESEPDFVPLLDLVLQLVMFFMLCANFVIEQTNVDIRLPKAAAARTLDKAVEYAIFLNVNKDGVVLLAPTDQYTDSQGNAISTLNNKEQVASFLRRRAAEEKGAGPAGDDKQLRSVIVLRVDQDCPFEKTYGIMQACRSAGYLRVQLRAVLASPDGK